jgi:hypothetical protein
MNLNELRGAGNIQTFMLTCHVFVALYHRDSYAICHQVSECPGSRSQQLNAMRSARILTCVKAMFLEMSSGLGVRTSMAKDSGQWLQLQCERMDDTLLFLCQIVNTATSSLADDVHHYVIPPKLLLTNRVYFQQTSGIHEPVGKRKGCSLSGRSPAPIADSFNVVTMARKHSVLNLREINRNNKHTALASV